MSKGTVSKEDLLQALSFAYSSNAGLTEPKPEVKPEAIPEQKPSVKLGEAVGLSAVDPTVYTLKEEEVSTGDVDDEKLPLQSISIGSDTEAGSQNEDSYHFSLSKFLENILSSLDIPLSVSFLNTFLYRSRLQEEITEEFVESVESRSKFSFFLLGCDFKVNLKEKPVAPKLLGDGSTHENEFYKIMQKDILSLRELQTGFARGNIVEVQYEDFLSNYSSNKYKRNLPYIVRNSHALKIERRDNETYVSFRKENEQEIRIWDLGFEKLRLACTKELLGYFTSPVPLGILQNCLSFNRDFVIDKSFLNTYYEIFEVRGVEVILKGVGSFSNEDMAQVRKRRKCSEDSDENKDDGRVPKPSGRFQDQGTRRNADLADIAVAEKCSIIVIGNNVGAIPVIYYDNSSSYSNRLAALEKLSIFIDRELAKLKE